MLYDFSFKNENFATFTSVVKDMFNLNPRHLRTFSQVLATVIKYFDVVFCIFKCILILLKWNIKCYHKTVLQFVYANKSK